MCKIDLGQCELELQFHRLKLVCKNNCRHVCEATLALSSKKEIYEYS